MCGRAHGCESVRMAPRHVVGHGAAGKGVWEPWESLMVFFLPLASGPTQPGPRWWVSEQEWVKAVDSQKFPGKRILCHPLPLPS